MTFVIFSVFYILIAAAMIVLILLQNGAGADAGSGFGSGASATVFGARGSATFLTRATGVLAGLFFLLSLGMGIYLHSSGGAHSNNDLGVMSGAASKTIVTPTPTPTPTPAPTPKPSSQEVPAAAPATQPASAVPQANKSEVPAATEPANKQH